MCQNQGVTQKTEPGNWRTKSQGWKMQDQIICMQPFMHFPALQFGLSFSKSCIFQVLLFYGSPFSGSVWAPWKTTLPPQTSGQFFRVEIHGILELNGWMCIVTAKPLLEMFSSLCTVPFSANDAPGEPSSTGEVNTPTSFPTPRHYHSLFLGISPNHAHICPTDKFSQLWH